MTEHAHAELVEGCYRCELNRDEMEETRITRRQWLTYNAVLSGAPISLATEAVASTAIEHPEWNMDELKTWEEWRKDARVKEGTDDRA